MKEYLVKLIKVKSNHKNLRTDTVEGVIQSLPKVGEPIVLFGKGLEFGTRVVHTTPIQSIEKIENVYTVITQNSTYRLELNEKLGDEK